MRDSDKQASGSILAVDDDPAVLRTLRRAFEEKYETYLAQAAQEAMDQYEAHRPDVVLLDLHLPDVSGMRLLELLCGRGATVLVLTGHADIPTAVEAVKVGAENFLTKPVDLTHLEAIVERAQEKAKLRRAQRFMTESAGEENLGGLGRSPKMRELAGQVERVAEAEYTTVLLKGESGTGKGWLAERIHQLSPRSSAAFVEVNCATLTGTFLESELFGHEKGAFTDAKAMKRGLFEIADGGTLLLDEIGDLDVNLQPKLLKVLESRTFRRIGGVRPIGVNVRLIAATNQDLAAAVEEKRFREDLLYRLNVMPITLPPLRERSPEDVADLAIRVFEELRKEFPRGPSTISPDALEVLIRHPWPGNVRELRNILERARIVSGGVEALEPQHLPAEIRGSTMLERSAVRLETLEDVEKRHIRLTLTSCEGNRTRAAEVLGISRGTLHNKIKKFQLEDVGRGDGS